MSSPHDPSRPSPPPPGPSGQVGSPESEQQTETPWWQKPTEVISTPAVTPASPNPPPHQPPSAPDVGMAPQYPQPYNRGAPPQFPPPTPASGKVSNGGSKGKFGLLVAVIGAVFIGLIIVGIAALAISGSFTTKKLNVNSVQAGVEQVLKDPVNGYASDDIKDVKCNNAQDATVKKGESFTCDVSVQGKKRKVTVTFRDDNGTYEVGLPQEAGK